MKTIFAFLSLLVCSASAQIYDHGTNLTVYGGITVIGNPKLTNVTFATDTSHYVNFRGTTGGAGFYWIYDGGTLCLTNTVLSTWRLYFNDGISLRAGTGGGETIGLVESTGAGTFSGTVTANAFVGDGSGITGLSSGVSVAAGTNVVMQTNGPIVTINMATTNANLALLDKNQTWTGSNNVTTMVITNAHFLNPITVIGETNTGTLVLPNLSGILQASSVDGSVSASISPSNLPLLNSVNTFSASNNFVQINAAGPITSTNGYLAPTNVWTPNGPLRMGAEYYVTSGAATLGIGTFSNIDPNSPSVVTLRVGATGSVVFTNDNSVKASDFVISRALTNGNLGTISVEIWPRVYTNMFFVQTK